MQAMPPSPTGALQRFNRMPSPLTKRSTHGRRRRSHGAQNAAGPDLGDGFRDGALRSTLFDDVPAALQAWQAAGMDLRIYSSGSVHAQKLFFAHTEVGDLTPLFSAYYDTTIGSKREAASYTAIAADCQTVTESILFISDVVAELDAAREARPPNDAGDSSRQRATHEARSPRHSPVSATFHCHENPRRNPIAPSKSFPAPQTVAHH